MIKRTTIGISFQKYLRLLAQVLRYLWFLVVMIDVAMLFNLLAYGRLA